MNAEGVAHHARWQAVVLPLLQFADHPWRVRRKQVLGVSIVKTGHCGRGDDVCSGGRAYIPAGEVRCESGAVPQL
jgi:hypothetical protein